ncbi:MAG TPA: 30S ribosomal protein S6 [Clostridiales bacterium]|nr:30S ribosomal protein S6 [Clostridiales bacterium]
MKKYEMLFILRPDIEEEERNQVIEKFKTIVAERQGEVENVDEWGNRKLAYEIQKLNEGYYVLMNFKAGVDVPHELDRNAKILDSVIRHLIVCLDNE